MKLTKSAKRITPLTWIGIAFVVVSAIAITINQYTKHSSFKRGMSRGACTYALLQNGLPEGSVHMRCKALIIKDDKGNLFVAEVTLTPTKE